MFCPMCGNQNPDSAAFCASCGKPLENAPTQSAVPPVPPTSTPVSAPAPATEPTPAPATEPTPAPATKTTTTEPTIPSQYRPLSAWGYVGYNILFAIPIVGFILQIVFAFSKKNLNRRAYARSFFCTYLLAAIVGLLALLVYFILLIVAFGGFSLDMFM